MPEQRTSQNKQILDKLDVLTAEIFSLKGDMAAIKTQIEMQPKIDQQSFDNLRQANVSCQSTNNVRFGAVEERVKKIENSQTWLVRTTIGEGIAIILYLVSIVYNSIPK
jgi:hypothetical protein